MKTVFQAKITSDNHTDEVLVFFDLQLVMSIINSAIGTAHMEEPPHTLTGAEEIILETTLFPYVSKYLSVFIDGILFSYF